MSNDISHIQKIIPVVDNFWIFFFFFFFLNLVVGGGAMAEPLKGQGGHG